MPRRPSTAELEFDQREFTRAGKKKIKLLTPDIPEDDNKLTPLIYEEPSDEELRLKAAEAFKDIFKERDSDGIE